MQIILVAIATSYATEFSQLITLWLEEYGFFFFFLAESGVDQFCIKFWEREEMLCLFLFLP